MEASVKKQAHKAISALHKRLQEENDQNNLLPEDRGYYLRIILKRPIRTSYHPHPKPVRLPNSLAQEAVEAFLIVKNGDEEHYANALEKDVPQIKKVMSLKTFKENYKTFESRRKLVASYDRFLVDKRIAHEIVGPVGKPFFDNPSRLPIPIRLNQGEGLMASRIKQILDGTLIRPRHTKQDAIKFGSQSMTEKQLLENFDALCPVVVEKYAKDWSNVMELEVFVRDFPALPFYWSLPDDNIVEEGKDDQKSKKSKKNKDKKDSKKKDDSSDEEMQDSSDEQ